MRCKLSPDLLGYEPRPLIASRLPLRYNCIPTVVQARHGTALPAAAASAPEASKPTAAPSEHQKPLTPRQKRLAQQRSKWEESRKAQPQAAQPQREPSPHSARVEPRAAPPPRAARKAQPPQPPRRQHGDPDGAPAASPQAVPEPQATGARRGTRPAASAALRVTSPPAASPPPPSQPAPKPRSASDPLSTSTPRAASPADASPAPPAPDAPAWPSLLAPGPLPPALSLRALPGPHLASLACAWAGEVAALDRHAAPDAAPSRAASPSHAAGQDSSNGGAVYGSTTKGGGLNTPASGEAAAGAAGAGLLACLPPHALSKLQQLRKAADAAVAHGSLGRQELADLAWAMAHFDREHAAAALEPAMGVPFRVMPRFMPGLRLEDLLPEVELRRDTIYLDGGARAVEESRLTGWQSDIGATFQYSGKEMLPQAGGLTPWVRKVRDQLEALTGVWYDSVLINLYPDGKCGMRYHVDPLYGRWDPDTAVVSLGDTRTFIFRSMADHDIRWQYRVRNGDCVRMWGDCQDTLQHAVRVERRAEDAGPRMSLVYKRRLRGPDAGYL